MEEGEEYSRYSHYYFPKVVVDVDLLLPSSLVLFHAEYYYCHHRYYYYYYYSWVPRWWWWTTRVEGPEGPEEVAVNRVG